MKIEKKSATKYIPMQKRKGWYPPIAEKVDLRFMVLDFEFFLGFGTCTNNGARLLFSTIDP